MTGTAQGTLASPGAMGTPRPSPGRPFSGAPIPIVSGSIVSGALVGTTSLALGVIPTGLAGNCVLAPLTSVGVVGVALLSPASERPEDGAGGHVADGQQAVAPAEGPGLGVGAPPAPPRSSPGGIDHWCVTSRSESGAADTTRRNIGLRRTRRASPLNPRFGLASPHVPLHGRGTDRSRRVPDAQIPCHRDEPLTQPCIRISKDLGPYCHTCGRTSRCRRDAGARDSESTGQRGAD